MSRTWMLRILLIRLLGCHLVQNVDVNIIVFRVSGHHANTRGKTVRCARTCSQEDTCVGFHVSSNECTLLNLPNAAPRPGHTLYLSQDRIEENVRNAFLFCFSMFVMNQFIPKVISSHACRSRKCMPIIY